MVRKRKKAEDTQKPWCYYCDRAFNDEPTLIQHQRAKHFKCQTCSKKLTTAQGLSVHCMQVHKKTLDAVPFAKPGKGDPTLEIFGMSGVPAGLQPGEALEDEGQEEAPVSTPAAISVPSSAAASKPVAVQPDPAVGYASAVAPTPPVYPAAAPYAPQPYPAYPFAPPAYPGAPPMAGYPSLPPQPGAPFPIRPGLGPNVPLPGQPPPIVASAPVPPAFLGRPPLFPIGVPPGVPGGMGAPGSAPAPAAPLFPIGQAPAAPISAHLGPPRPYGDGGGGPHTGQSGLPPSGVPGQSGQAPPLFPLHSDGTARDPGSALSAHSRDAQHVGNGGASGEALPALAAVDGDLVWTDPELSQEEVRALSPKYKAFVDQRQEGSVPGSADPARSLPPAGHPQQSAAGGPPTHHGQAPLGYYNQMYR